MNWLYFFTLYGLGCMAIYAVVLRYGEPRE